MQSVNSYHEHQICRSCETPLEHVLVDLGVSPLANALVPPERLADGELFLPLKVMFCDACGLAQTSAWIAPESIFSDYAYFSSWSTSWLEHCARYAAQARDRLSLGTHSLVVEVASNDGYLLQYFQRDAIPVLGVEPAGNVADVAREKGIPTVAQFFGRDTAATLVRDHGRADLLIANNVLAHVPDINDFVAGIRFMLQPQGVATIEFPHLLNLIRETQFDTIYHEHFSYLSLTAVRNLFHRHDLRIFDVETLPTHGGSLRVWACPSDAGWPASSTVDETLTKEAEAGITTARGTGDFADRVRRIKCDTLAYLVDAVRQGRSIAAYGAAAKGNTFLNYCGIGPEFIRFVVDRNPVKQGRYLPGSRIPVLPVDTIFSERPDIILILPWNLRDEIVAQLEPAREWGARFVTCIPGLCEF